MLDKFSQSYKDDNYFGYIKWLSKEESQQNLQVLLIQMFVAALNL